MAEHQKFNFQSLEELKAKCGELNVFIPFLEDTSVLKRPVKIGKFTSPNSLVVHPLECRDGLDNCQPSDLTYRRYRRQAEGGAGIIWIEATAVTDDSRSVPNQLMLRESNLSDFEKLVDIIKKSATLKNGDHNVPLCAIELTHSGRYAKTPILAYHNHYLDQHSKLSEDYPLASDDELKQLSDSFVEKAKLAVKAGFELIEIKSCHGYLFGELLSARNRKGAYGGPFENRTKALLETIDRITEAIHGQAEVTVRIGAYDWIPNGWGMAEDGSFRLDPSEPILLMKEMLKHGVKIVNVSAGNPYIKPCIGRPFDMYMKGDPIPDEHPLEGVARFMNGTAAIQEAVPEMKMIGSGYSWLRQYLGMAAAANIASGRISMVGLGRGALAYPDFANDLLSTGKLDSRKVCITCSLCSQLMRKGGPAGCMVRDTQTYKPYFDLKCR